MKFHFKHVATAALAVAMSLSLAVPAFAAGPKATPTPVAEGNLTVTGHELTGKNVFAVRMFTARAFDGTEEGPNYSYDSYTLEAKWEGFFRDKTYMTDEEWEEAGVIGGDGAPSEITDYSEAALKYLEWLAKKGNSDKVPAFAEDAQDWLYKQNPAVFTVSGQNVTVNAGWRTLAYCEKASKMENPDDNLPTGTATFDNLPTGYYVVFPEGGSTGNESRGTDAMLINIPTDEQRATWNIKSTYPTVDKTVDTDKDDISKFEPDGTANVGDTVTFKLETTITDLSDFDKYRLAFVDELSEGLTYVDNSVKVYYLEDGTSELSQGKLLTKDTHYTVNTTAGLKIELTDVLDKTKGIAGIKAGDKIVVTYDATINSDAITEVDYVNNKVHLDYSNNPDGTGHGTSTPDESKVYIYDFTIDKYTMVPSEEQEGEAKKVNLSGAVFELKKEKKESADAIKLIAVSGQEHTYRVATPDEIKPDSGVVVTTRVTTPDSGQITIEGLEAGTYYLYEVTAPTGYNKLKDPLEIKIIVDKETAATYAPAEDSDKYNDVSFEKPLYVVDKKPNATNNDTINVENKKGIELPETGSIGTIGLTVAGVAIVLIGVFAPRKKKKSNQE